MKNKPSGEVSQAVHALLDNFFIEKNLRNITWTTSSGGPSHWSFGTTTVDVKTQVVRATLSRRNIKLGEARRKKQTTIQVNRIETDNNFSFDNYATGIFPFAKEFDVGLQTPFDTNLKAPASPQLERWYGSSFLSRHVSPQPAERELMRARLSELHRLNNPLLVAQGSDTSCMSCHLIDQTLTLAEVADPSLVGMKTSSQFATPPPIWSKWAKRTLSDFRNFAYQPAMRAALPTRLLYEVEDVRNTLNSLTAK